MERVYCVLVLSLRLVLSQYAQSPCPGVFDYGSDGADVYGVVQLVPNSPVSSLTIKTIFTVATQLNSNYAGRIEAEDSARLLRKYNSGVPVTVRVHFPVTSPLPRLTALNVNGNTICSGPAEFRPGEDITTLSLQHTAYLRSVDDEDDSIDINEAWDNNNTPNSIKNIETPEPTSSTPFNERPATTRRTLVTTSKPRVTSINYPNQSLSPTQRPVSSSSQNVDCGVVANRPPNNKQSYTRGDIPWLVAVYRSKKYKLDFICGGTLVTDLHVVTAAHCMKRRLDVTPITEMVIKVGVHDLDAWSDDITVTRSVVSADIHDAYNASSLQNDLLVLTLDKRVEFNNYIRPACLWAGNTNLNFVVGASGVVGGWGDQGSTHQVWQPVPHMIHLTVVSTAECRASNIAFQKFTSSKTLCAGAQNGTGPCKGDSGGGLYLLDSGRWRLRGVLSLALRQPNDETCIIDYTVFTDTAQYLDWIKKIISNVYYE